MKRTNAAYTSKGRFIPILIGWIMLMGIGTVFPQQNSDYEQADLDNPINSIVQNLQQLYEQRPLTINLPQLPDYFNPFQSDATQQQIVSLLYDTLYTRLPNSVEPFPWLAADVPSIHQENKYIDIALREGVHFSNGFALTADDVVFSYRLYNLFHFPLNRANFQYIHQISKIDDTHIRLHTSKLSGSILFNTLVETPILPKVIWEVLLFREWGIRIDSIKSEDISYYRERLLAYRFQLGEVIGSGPFQLENYRAGIDYQFRANSYYFKRGESIQVDGFSAQIGPHFKEMRWKVSTQNDASNLAAFVDQQVDYIIWQKTAQPPAHVDLHRVGSVLVNHESSITVLIFNQTHPLFQDARARKLFYIHTHLDNLIRIVLSDAYDPAPYYQPVHVNRLFTERYPQQFQKYQIRVVPGVFAGLSFLEQFRYIYDAFTIPPESEALKIIVSQVESEQLQLLANEMGTFFSQTKYPIEVHPVSPEQLREEIIPNSAFDVLLITIRVPFYPHYLHHFFHSANQLPGGMNIGGYHNNTVDTHLEQLIHARTLDHMVSEVESIMGTLYGELPWIPLGTKRKIEVVNRWLEPWVQYNGSVHNRWSYLLLHLSRNASSTIG